MTIEASAAQSARIDHYTAFWSEVVGPDYEEFMKAQHDLRLAFHCAVSLFHMSDWVYEAEKATVDASFTFIDKNGRFFAWFGKGRSGQLERAVMSASDLSRHSSACTRTCFASSPNLAAKRHILAKSLKTL
jgi:hypothetical protein